ncbi:MAG: PAS domain S-box protein [Gemmatimonadetes bacterium]|nr:PAS domain S-box protein [Gemmatimonadota bacterium]
MPGLNIGLLAAELLILAAVVLFLHAESRRYGLAPLLIYLAGLVVLLDTSGPHGLFVRLGSIPIEVSTVTLVPVILMTLLVLYRVNGTAAARVTIIGIVGLSALVLFVQLARAGSAELGAMPGGGDIVQDLSVVGGEWRTTVSSLVAFIVSLTTVAVVDQALLNRFRWLPRWVTPGVALLAGALMDDVVFRVGELGPHGFVNTFPDGFPAKAAGVLLLWPLVSAYLLRVAPWVMSGTVADERPIFDIIFGTYGQRDVALRATATRLTSVISQAPVVMFAVDADGTFTLSEGAGLAALGLRPGEVVGQSAFDLFPEAADHIRAALGGDQISTAQQVGDLSWDVTYTPMIRGQTVVGVSGVATDITAKVRAEAALTETELRFRSTFEEAAVGLAHVDPRGRIILANKVLGALVSHPDGSLVGKTLTNLLHPDFRAGLVAGLRSLLTGEKGHHVEEARLLRVDGSSVWVGTTVSLVRDQYGSPLYFIAVVEDLTPRRTMEEQLRQAQKMEAVGHLTGGVAHDFNNFLTVVIGGIQLALSELDDPQERAEVLEQALQAAQRGAALTQRLLVFSRRQALRPVPLDVAALIGGLRTLLQRLVPETMKVHIDVAGDAGWCEADRAQLESAILNLAVNAKDAMRDDGTLTLRASRMRVTPEALPVPEAKPGLYVRITVEDDGDGMPPEVQRHIFEPFFTTKAVGKGSGLGLSTVYGFVTQSGGFVTLSSEVGVGTQVNLHLPATPSPSLD